MKFPYEDLTGKPFRFGARGPDAYDCWGLVRECLRRQGLRPPDYPSSDSGALNAAMVVFAAGTPGWRELAQAEPGCVVAFRMRGGMVSHVGVMIDALRFLHITDKTFACTERLSHPLWARRIAGFYQLAS